MAVEGDDADVRARRYTGYLKLYYSRITKHHLCKHSIYQASEGLLEAFPAPVVSAPSVASAAASVQEQDVSARAGVRVGEPVESKQMSESCSQKTDFSH